MPKGLKGTEVRETSTIRVNPLDALAEGTVKIKSSLIERMRHFFIKSRMNGEFQNLMDGMATGKLSGNVDTIKREAAKDFRDYFKRLSREGIDENKLSRQAADALVNRFVEHGTEIIPLELQNGKIKEGGTIYDKMRENQGSVMERVRGALELEKVRANLERGKFSAVKGGEVYDSNFEGVYREVEDAVTNKLKEIEAIKESGTKTANQWKGEYRDAVDKAEGLGQFKDKLERFKTGQLGVEQLGLDVYRGYLDATQVKNLKERLDKIQDIQKKMGVLTVKKGPKLADLGGQKRLEPVINDLIQTLNEKVGTWKTIREKVEKGEKVEGGGYAFEGDAGNGKDFTIEILKNSTSAKVVKFELRPDEMLGGSEKALDNWFKDVNSLLEKGPVVVYFNEIDSTPGMKGATGTHGGIDKEWYGIFKDKLEAFQNKGGIIIGSTNNYEELDSAIRSRLNTHLNYVDPDMDGRIDMLEKQLKFRNGGDLELSPDLVAKQNISQLADIMGKISGRTMSYIINDARRLAAREQFTNTPTLESKHLLQAIKAKVEAAGARPPTN